MSVSAASFSAYTQVEVETASQGKLIVMLFNGAIKRAEEAKRQLDGGSYEGVHNNLLRSQDIVAELRGALNMNAGQVASNLDRIYEYFQHLLVSANVQKDTAPIEECVELMTSMRDTWQEVFDGLPQEVHRDAQPQINQHGNSLLNIQG